MRLPSRYLPSLPLFYIIDTTMSTNATRACFYIIDAAMSTNATRAMAHVPHHMRPARLRAAAVTHAGRRTWRLQVSVREARAIPVMTPQRPDTGLSGGPGMGTRVRGVTLKNQSGANGGRETGAEHRQQGFGPPHAWGARSGGPGGFGPEPLGPTRESAAARREKSVGAEQRRPLPRSVGKGNCLAGAKRRSLRPHTTGSAGS